MIKLLGWITFIALAIFLYGAVEWNSIIIHPEKGFVALGAVAAGGYKIFKTVLGNNT